MNVNALMAPLLTYLAIGSVLAIGLEIVRGYLSRAAGGGADD